MHMLFKD